MYSVSGEQGDGDKRLVAKLFVIISLENTAIGRITKQGIDDFFFRSNLCKLTDVLKAVDIFPQGFTGFNKRECLATRISQKP